MKEQKNEYEYCGKEADELWSDSTFYNEYVRGELADFRKEAWKKVLSRHIEGGKTLDILDVGTGPGFFAVLLSEMGHYVTGIDSSLAMLKSAEENTRGLVRTPEFLQMDIENMSFKKEMFDLIVCRNVIWVLDEPEKVYGDFYQILKPGGKLLVYDANWNMPFFDKEMQSRVKQHELDYYNETGIQFKVRVEEEKYYLEKPLANIFRPDWDFRTLHEQGFEKIKTNLDIGSSVYQKWEKKLYQETPLFEICAEK